MPLAIGYDQESQGREGTASYFGILLSQTEGTAVMPELAAALASEHLVLP